MPCEPLWRMRRSTEAALEVRVPRAAVAATASILPLTTLFAMCCRSCAAGAGGTALESSLLVSTDVTNPEDVQHGLLRKNGAAAPRIR